MNKLLIGESGGTKTDWCLVENGKCQKVIRSFSLHPSNWNLHFFKKLNSFLNQNFDLKNTEIKIYSAGCLSKERQQELVVSIGLKENKVSVRSDLHAAGAACLAGSNGEVAILGTGSVLFSMEGNEVISVVGGKGFLNGDEGSGYYFGKLILEAYIEGELTKAQVEILSQKTDLNKLKQKFLDQEGKFEIAELAMLLSEYKATFSSFHLRNFQMFIDTHKGGMNEKSLYIVGGYAYHHQHELKSVFERNKVTVVSIIEKPIDALIEQSVFLND